MESLVFQTGIQHQAWNSDVTKLGICVISESGNMEMNTIFMVMQNSSLLFFLKKMESAAFYRKSCYKVEACTVLCLYILVYFTCAYLYILPVQTCIFYLHIPVYFTCIYLYTSHAQTYTFHLHIHVYFTCKDLYFSSVQTCIFHLYIPIYCTCLYKCKHIDQEQ